MTDNKLIVSVCMITYNHAQFIEQAIEGVLIQETNFEFDLIISNDCSKDTSDSCIRNLIASHPKGNLVKYFNHISNIGMSLNADFALKECTGKYIALCEGDDYWTDPKKLQKQVDFLEANPDFSICFHNAEELFEDIDKPSFLYCNTAQKEVSTLEDLLTNGNFIPTCSAIFRSHFLKNFPTWFIKLGMGDWILHILNAQQGKIKYINEVMGVHRIHGGGIWSGSESVKNNIYVYEAYIKLAEHFSMDAQLLPIIHLKCRFFLQLIYREYIGKKEKKEAFRYFIKFISLNPLRILKPIYLKDLIKIAII